LDQRIGYFSYWHPIGTIDSIIGTANNLTNISAFLDESTEIKVEVIGKARAPIGPSAPLFSPIYYQ